MKFNEDGQFKTRLVLKQYLNLNSESMAKISSELLDTGCSFKVLFG